LAFKKLHTLNMATEPYVRFWPCKSNRRQAAKKLEVMAVQVSYLSVPCQQLIKATYQSPTMNASLRTVGAAQLVPPPVQVPPPRTPPIEVFNGRSPAAERYLHYIEACQRLAELQQCIRADAHIGM
jgi:hypothetical protein